MFKRQISHVIFLINMLVSPSARLHVVNELSEDADFLRVSEVRILCCRCQRNRLPAVRDEDAKYKMCLNFNFQALTT
jgi:hypothetical protein